ncbi:MAG: response regulator transcription factor [Pseudonocardia sp.]|nr:response regulator transcription factor [Pseudonocardia sp.]
MDDRRRIRLLLVDDRPSARRGLRMWLALEPDLEVVGEADHSVDVCGLVGSLRPDVVLIGMAMRLRGGFEATADVGALEPKVPVVVLSLHDDLETKAQAWAVGAAAFVSKHEVAPLLVHTIREVAGGTRSLPGTGRP